MKEGRIEPKAPCALLRLYYLLYWHPPDISAEKRL